MAGLELKGLFQMDLSSNIAKHTMNLETLVTQMKFEQSGETRQSLGLFRWLYFVGWCFAYIYKVVRHMYVLAIENRRGHWILSDWSFQSM